MKNLTTKGKIEQAFSEFAEKQNLSLFIREKHSYYNSLSGAKDALKILQMLIGGEIQKGQRVLSTYTTDYIIENLESGSTIYKIIGRVTNKFVAERVKSALEVD